MRIRFHPPHPLYLLVHLIPVCVYNELHVFTRSFSPHQADVLLLRP